ncbi:acyltransferase [Actinomadura spongiicola]|uniref:Acyltransferase n=1 Tax=Actinomadura spongiicola TaxID=2303421 RepID=A0A372GL05_9ACTN|nr:acyltransferase family protein [Actinomadura spongiicola]RFS86064.1 acyltransferase [Actinomadura spongiicola]
MTQTPEASVAGETAAGRSPERPPEARRTAGGAAPRGRDPHLDNAKFLAILLVATGHGVAGLDDVPLASATYYFFYLFHMPVFVMISGYLSKRFTLTDDRVVRLLGATLAPYVIFQTAYGLFAWAFGDRKFEIELLNPYYITWFLLALFVWRLFTPIWRRARFPLAGAVLVALLAFMSDLGGTLDIYRILGLMPFYVLGLTLRPEMLEIVRRPAARVVGAVALTAGFVGAFVAYPRMDARWIRWTHSNADMGVGELTGTVMRMGLLLAGVVLIAAFLAVVPSRRTWYTDLGAGTLYTYLLHGFLTRLFTFTGWNEAGWLHGVPGVLLVAVVCCVVATLLSTGPVRRVTRWAIEPDIRPLFTKQ